MNKTSFVFSVKNNILLKDKILLASFFSILIGLISGTIVYIVSDSAKNENLLELFTFYGSEFSKTNSMEIISGIVLYALPYFIIMYILGGSIYGKSICYIVTAIKAMGISLITSGIYTEYGLKGLEYALLVFFPGKIIIVFSMLLCTKTSVKMSSAIINECKNELSLSIKAYTIKYLLILIILFIYSVTEFIFIKIFSELFVT